ncbi:extensin family protein [Roseovarius sp. MMSF_3359]|uniref:extensin-like domain-containing protein n=1 Tax=Roseovarius sp. MMSF_3359 TaxID=3046707 RepID=UPI002740126F|nr:extensin family protein [Roseovarius sp. MMSF_3359]
MRYDWKAFRPALRRAVLRLGLIVVLFGGYVTLFHPKSPLPDPWHPFTPLDVEAPLTGLTKWKLRNALSSDAACLQALEGAAFTRLAPLQDSPQCHITPRIALTEVGNARLPRVETRCQTALRLAMWEKHGLQVAAARHLDTQVSDIRHFSSYNCRQIRTPGGSGGRMSSHATADAIDISGFRTKDGRVIRLKADWDGEDATARFLRDAFASACLWFPVSLGPDYNALHADHFHLQGSGWGLCR